MKIPEPRRFSGPGKDKDQGKIRTMAHSIDGMKMFENTYCYMVLPQLREEMRDTMACTQKVEPKTHTVKPWKSSEKTKSQETNLLETYEHNSNHQDIRKTFTRSS